MPLEKQTKAFLDKLAELNPPGWETMTPVEARTVFSQMTEMFGHPDEVFEASDVTLGGVPTRLYRPSAQAKLPVVLYFHGGGWVLGGLDTHDVLCRTLARFSQCAVVAVDYSLSPEEKFPVALDECYRVVNTIASDGASLNVDGTRIAVAGDSAGGNLAAALALMARDRNGPTIRHQLLFYPVISPQFETESYRQFAEGFGLTRAGMRWFWRQYLSDDSQRSDPYAVPLVADDLSGLPPAHVVTAEFDVLRDEGEAYARRLIESGVPTTLRRLPGLIHGCVHFVGVMEVGKAALIEAAEEVGKSLAELG